MQENDLVQPIVVSKTSVFHEDVVTAVAFASCKALIATFDDPIWREWLSGRFTKSVRRATPGAISKMPKPAFLYQEKELTVAAFKPMSYEDMPKSIRNAQVSNTDFPRDTSRVKRATPNIVNYHNDYTGGPTIWINEDLEMSTGKCAAQAAHGAMISLCNSADTELLFWEKDRPAFSVQGVKGQDFEKALEKASWVVNDAGLTEIEPGSTTVAVTQYHG